MAGFFDKIINRGKFTCPFCFSSYDKERIKYVCPDCGEETIPTTSSERGKPSIKCKNCGRMATVRLCPHCGEYDKQMPEEARGVIPASVLDADGSLPFCIIGVSSSGKTNFITVMLHEMSRVPELRIALSAQNKYTRDVQRENYTNIYEKHIPPRPTDPTELGERLKPQLWQIKNLMRQKSSSTPTYTFTIYDGAGEDHTERLDATSAICGYINASNAVIITLDPLILTNLRRMINPDIRRNSGASEGDTNSAENIVNSVAAYIKVARNIPTNKMLTIPVAVVLTKFDTILQLDSLPAGAVVRKPSMTFSGGKVNMTEITQVDEEIRDWLYSIGEGSFITALESNFKKFYFFGISSYGKPPETQGSVNENINPHRILDPVLWLFKEEKFID